MKEACETTKELFFCRRDPSLLIQEISKNGAPAGIGPNDSR